MIKETVAYSCWNYREKMTSRIVSWILLSSPPPVIMTDFSGYGSVCSGEPDPSLTETATTNRLLSAAI